MENIIIILILAVIMGLAARYILKAKKRGVKCIGCPNGCGCSRKNSDSGGCCCGSAEK